MKKAFPSKMWSSHYHSYIPTTGMDLRDWFAGQVLSSIILHPQGPSTPKELAQDSYKIADAMMKARENG